MGKGMAILAVIAIAAGLLLVGMLSPTKEKTGREKAAKPESKA